MTKLWVLAGRSARAGEFAGSTDAAIPIDYARDTLEELTALVQRWQHHFADNATVLLAGGGADCALRALGQGARLASDRESGSLRRLAAA